jgi:hypothetical protein
MNHPSVRKINATEKDINTQLYIFHHKIIEVLMNLRPINVTDDFLSKTEQVKIALDSIIENRPEWFHKAYQRNGNA